jgi:hypothetical protein
LIVFGKFNNWRYEDLCSLLGDHGMQYYHKISFCLSSCGFFSPHQILNQSTLGLDEENRIREGKNEKADQIIIMYHLLSVYRAQITQQNINKQADKNVGGKKERENVHQAKDNDGKEGSCIIYHLV